MKTKKIMMSLAALCLLASGLQAQPQMGTLVVFRMWHLQGCAVSLPFWINEKLVAKLRNGYYCKLELPAGDYVIRHAHNGTFFTTDPQKIHISAGQTLYFYNQVTGLGYVFEVAEDQADAQQKVKGLKQQN